MYSPPTPPQCGLVGPASPAVQLELPRLALDTQLGLSLRPPATDAPELPAASGWLAHGPLVIQPGWPRWRLLVGGLHAGAPARWVQPASRPSAQSGRAALPHPPVQGLALVYLAGADEHPPGPLPAHSQAQHQPGLPNHPAQVAQPAQTWDDWLARHVPGHRLASPALIADLAVLWLRADGTATAAFRPGDAWARLHPPGTDNRPAVDGPGWRAVPCLNLPGAQMLRLALQRTAAPVAPVSVPPELKAEPEAEAEGRYSRQAGALGPTVLARLQACQVALVGAGLVGSVLAHSLARMGCSLLVIDPGLMAPRSLDGDLPPLMEGQAKVLALQRQLRGLMRPGATLTLRMLPMANPAAGALVGDADIVLCTSPSPAARWWASAWALATLKPLLAVATAMQAEGATADLQLLPPGAGCLACCSGLGQAAAWPLPPALPRAAGALHLPGRGHTAVPRSWAMFSGHAGLRLLEHMVAGRHGAGLSRHLAETTTGGLSVRDGLPAACLGLACPLCTRLSGAGAGAVQPALLAALAAQMAAASAQGSPP